MNEESKGIFHDAMVACQAPAQPEISEQSKEKTMMEKMLEALTQGPMDSLQLPTIASHPQCTAYYNPTIYSCAANLSGPWDEAKVETSRDVEYKCPLPADVAEQLLMFGMKSSRKVLTEKLREAFKTWCETEKINMRILPILMIACIEALNIDVSEKS